MAKFRLKQALLKGEEIAEIYGFKKFSVDPFEIAEQEDIVIQAKDPEMDGVSGCIVFNNDGVGIIYSTRIKSSGFQRFTVAHELGHYFLEGHPEEIIKTGGFHASRAGFTEGNNSIELEADHFASGLLMPTRLVKDALASECKGMDGIKALADEAQTSLTAAAIRSAECAPYPIAIVVSHGSEICYSFMSENFKSLGHLTLLRKGDHLPASATLNFNSNSENVQYGKSECTETNLSSWFDGSKNIYLDEQIVGLGSYGLTLTVLSSDALPEDPYDEPDEDAELEESWTPRFARGR